MNKTTLESLEEALERLEHIDGKYSWAHLLYEVREALAEPEITTLDVCGEVCARAKLCYGCGKALDEANAKLAEPYACEAGECPDKSLCAGAFQCLFKAEPVNQEPVADKVLRLLEPFMPVDAKAIRAEALEDAVKFLEENGMIAPNGFTAAGISALKKMHTRTEPLGGQNFKYVQLQEALEDIAALPIPGEEK